MWLDLKRDATGLGYDVQMGVITASNEWWEQRIGVCISESQSILNEPMSYFFMSTYDLFVSGKCKISQVSGQPNGESR
jgi:hypothetical protein